MTGVAKKENKAGWMGRFAGLRANFSLYLLALAGIAGAALLVYSRSWDWAGPVITLAFITSLVLSELVSSLESRFFKDTARWLNRLNLPLFILFGCVLAYKVIGILTMPEP